MSEMETGGAGQRMRRWENVGEVGRTEDEEGPYQSSS